MLKSDAMKMSLVAVACSIALAAAADDVTQRIDVPAGDLVEALQALEKQSHSEFVYQAAQLKGLRTQGVNGTLSTQEAVRKLLEGTKLRMKMDEATGAMLIALPYLQNTSALSSLEDGGGQSPERADRIRLAQVEQTSPAHEEGQGEVDQQTAATEQTDEQARSPKVTELEELVVTGTRIRNASPTSRVIVVDRKQIESSGYSQLDQLLQGVPQSFKGGASSDVNPFSPGSANTNTTFASGVNLRGLGTDATLVLLNGRRLAPTADGGNTDISLIPLSLIQRVEILTDGASALYGSDAIAGVVNIVTRRDFEGAETQLRYGAVTEGDKDDYQTSQLLGRAWSTGNAAFGVEYQRSNPLYARDRAFASKAGPGTTLFPLQESTGGYAAVSQQLTSDLAVDLDLILSQRRFRGDTMQFLTVGKGTTTTSSAGASARYRVSDDWRVVVDGSVSRQRDEAEFNYRALGFVSDSSYAYDVRSVEPRIDGPLLQLPGGALRLAAGLSYQSESIETGSLDDGRSSSAVFAELLAPFVGLSNRRRGLEQLDLSVAARYERYSDFGTTANPKVGIRWSPIVDISVRAGFTTSFKAPTLSQLAVESNNSAYIFDVADPASATGSSVALIRLGANPDLEPETAKVWTYGLAYEGDDLGGFTWDLSYFNIDYRDRITNLYTQVTLNVLNKEAVYADYITRSPTDAQIAAILAEPGILVVNDAGVPLNSTGIGSIADLRFQNAAEVRSEGIDAELRWSRDTRFGVWSADLNLSYLLDFSRKLTPSAETAVLADRIYNPADLRAKLELRWTRGSWSLSGRASYVDDYLDNLSAGCVAIGAACPVDAWTTADLNAGFTFPSGPLRGLLVQATVQNLFNEDPPFVRDTTRRFGYDPTNANALKRHWSVSVSKRW